MQMLMPGQRSEAKHCISAMFSRLALDPDQKCSHFPTCFLFLVIFPSLPIGHSHQPRSTISYPRHLTSASFVPPSQDASAKFSIAILVSTVSMILEQDGLVGSYLTMEV